MSGPFDAATKILRKYIGGDPDSLNSELASAIRVLEVAGKVDKETVSVVLGDVRTLLAREGRTAFIWAIKDALALLSALPDKASKAMEGK